MGPNPNCRWSRLPFWPHAAAHTARHGERSAADIPRFRASLARARHWMMMVRDGRAAAGGGSAARTGSVQHADPLPPVRVAPPLLHHLRPVPALHPHRWRGRRRADRRRLVRAARRELPGEPGDHGRPHLVLLRDRPPLPADAGAADQRRRVLRVQKPTQDVGLARGSCKTTAIEECCGEKGVPKRVYSAPIMSPRALSPAAMPAALTSWESIRTIASEGSATLKKSETSSPSSSFICDRTNTSALVLSGCIVPGDAAKRSGVPLHTHIGDQLMDQVAGQPIEEGGLSGRRRGGHIAAGLRPLAIHDQQMRHFLTLPQDDSWCR